MQLAQEITQLRNEIEQTSIAIQHHERPQDLKPDPSLYPAIGQLSAVLDQIGTEPGRKAAIEHLKKSLEGKRDRLAELENEQAAAAQRLADGSKKLADAGKAIVQAHEAYLRAIANYAQMTNELAGDRGRLGVPHVPVLRGVLPVHLHSRLSPVYVASDGSLAYGEQDFITAGGGINPRYLDSSAKEERLQNAA